MSTTRKSLLLRLIDNDADAWNAADKIYRPMVFGWLCKNGVSQHDAEDLCQDVMTTVSRNVLEFEHNGRVGAFRSWLRMITVNSIRNFRRKKNN